MIPFTYTDAGSIDDATAAIDHDGVMAIAGGTTMVDLMKLNVLTPDRVVHVRGVLSDDVEDVGDSIRVGAACTMASLADHPVVRESMPVIRQSLILAATPQIRNMATIAGNLMQRTRSTYFRHTDMDVDGPDGPRDDHSGHADASQLAVLGNGGRRVALYPGDFAVPFVALGGSVEVASRDGGRTIDAGDFYKTPTESFQYSTDLRPGEVVTHLRIPKSPAAKNSFYFKVRERSSYAFALVSVAAGLAMDGDTISDAKIGLGGLGSVPWHSTAAEDALWGKPATDDVFAEAARAAVADAEPPPGAEMKVPLARRAVVRTLRILRDRGPLGDQELFAMQHGRESR